MKIKKKASIIAVAFYLITNLNAVAQHADSTSSRSYWSPYRFGVRTAIGYQKTIFTEVGLSYHRAGGDIVAPSAQCFYGSLEWIPKILPRKSSNIYSLKVGYEHTGHLLVYALEGRYAADFINRKEFFITPKVGLGVLGSINILYGYNIPLSDNKYFKEIGKHQFSIVCNIDKLLTEGF